MDLIHLTYFVEVAHYKSFTKASRNLHISQPSISKGIRTLEEKWNVRLFHRHGKSIELTEVGEAILPRIEEILDRFQRLKETVSDPEHLHTGKLRIGVPPLISTLYLVDFLCYFMQQYPNIEIQILERPSGDIEKMLTDGSIHCGFCFVPSARDHHKSILLQKEPLRLFLHEEHPLAQKTEICGQDIQDEPLILYGNGHGIDQLVLQQMKWRELHTNLVLRSLSCDFILGLVEAKAGISILPALAETYMPRNYQHVVTRPLTDPEMMIAPGLVWDTKSYIGAPTERFVEVFCQYFRKMR